MKMIKIKGGVMNWGVSVSLTVKTSTDPSASEVFRMKETEQVITTLVCESVIQDP